MRRLVRTAAALAGLLSLAGCTTAEPQPPAPSSAARPAPPSEPRPVALTKACPLLNEGEVATALGGGRVSSQERPAQQRGGGARFVCVYRGSTVDLVLTASDAPREAESPARFVSTLARTDPAARQVRGLGDGAAFVHLAGADVQVLLGTAKYAGDRFRALTLALSTGDDTAQRPLTRLATAAFARM